MVNSLKLYKSYRFCFLYKFKRILEQTTVFNFNNNEFINQFLMQNETEHHLNQIKLLKGENLNIMYMNIQSIRNKLDDLNLMLHKIKTEQKEIIHIIALSEIWIFENENKFYNLDDYNAYFENRQSNRSGGCCVFIHKSINSTLQRKFEFELSSFIIIKLIDLNINFACVYRHCGSNMNNFTDKFENEILKRKRCIVVGDININLKNLDSDSMGYVDALYSNGSMCLNSMDEDKFTRKSNTIYTYIDHVITNITKNKYLISYMDLPISDHRTLFISTNIKSKSKHKQQNDNVIKIFDYEKFNENIETFDQDINNASCFTDFHNILRNTIRNYTKEIKKKNVIKNQWANDELITLIKKRDKYYRMMIKNSNNLTYKNLYEEHKVRAKNLKNYLKKKYYGDQIDKNMNNNKKLWQIFRNLMFNKSDCNESIKQIEHEHVIVTEKQEISNIMNDYFVNIVEVNNEIDKRMPTEVQHVITNNFELNACSENEIHEIINNLNICSSNGYDDISAKFVKKYANNIVNKLVEYTNEMLETGIFPSELKVGCVIPIHKNGSKHLCSNYRPITKLSVLDKIFEEVILIRLKRHLNRNKIISENQFGFVEKSNTLAATLSCVEKLYSLIDQRKYIAIISLDLRKAFDSVDHDCLLHILKQYKICDSGFKLFEDFLRNRQQFVQLDGKKSDMKNVKIGVPQGSKLASILFIIFLNNIFNLNLKSIPFFYADDGLLIFKADSYQELMDQITHDMHLVQKWFSEHFLKLNISKTKMLIVKNHNDIPEISDFDGIIFNNEKIKREDKIVFLGLTIDDRLKWNEHADRIKSKLVPINFAIYRIKSCIPKKHLWSIYHAHFLSHVNYLLPIWIGCADYKINQIQRLQNKVIKNIENKNILTPSLSLYVNKPNIRGLAFIQTVTTIKKIQLNLIKSNINLQTNSNVHGIFTRTLNNLRAMFFKFEKCQNSITSRGIMWYNKLPNEIKEMSNIIKFTTNVKRYVINNFVELNI